MRPFWRRDNRRGGMETKSQGTSMFKKILIANRGEIACRIIRTARDMGIATVAVYSEVDTNALHTELADEAFCIGPAPAISSYLHGENILKVAKQARVEAIHPGYGFLSENPDFAAACEAAGLIFIGPPANVITEMGIKGRAKEIMEKAGIPIIPGGYVETDKLKDLEQQADRAGYPLLIKADRGGGGKGIRMVEGREDLQEAIGTAGREAASAFGDSSLLWEKHIHGARHIEVQIFRDSHGKTLHLFERDCSLQRRHQKIIEEAPAPGLGRELLDSLYDAAVTAADAVGYIGAGTVEFLVDCNGQFYFLEINTRLQVEHPVTEMITNRDLVSWQLLVAAGEPLPCNQDDVQLSGHAIEARIYAEDPARDFMPSSGRIDYLREPACVSGLRIDGGIREGDSVTPFYDPILSKLIVHGRDRAEAIEKLLHGLAAYHLAGVTTNIDFLSRMASDTAFITAAHTTQYVDNTLESMVADQLVPDVMIAYAALGHMGVLQEEAKRKFTETADSFSPWGSCLGFRLNEPNRFCVHFQNRGKDHEVSVISDDVYTIAVGEETFTMSEVTCINHALRCRVNGRNVSAEVVHHGDMLTLFCEGRTIQFTLIDKGIGEGSGDGEGNSLRAPIPGNVTGVMAKNGQVVKKGDTIMVLEAMKMEYVIKAPGDGRVIKLLYAAGDSVEERDRLLEFELDTGSENATG